MHTIYKGCSDQRKDRLTPKLIGGNIAKQEETHLLRPSHRGIIFDEKQTYLRRHEQEIYNPPRAVLRSKPSSEKSKRVLTHNRAKSLPINLVILATSPPPPPPQSAISGKPSKAHLLRGHHCLIIFLLPTGAISATSSMLVTRCSGSRRKHFIIQRSKVGE